MAWKKTFRNICLPCQPNHLLAGTTRCHSTFLQHCWNKIVGTILNVKLMPQGSQVLNLTSHVWTDGNPNNSPVLLKTLLLQRSLSHLCCEWLGRKQTAYEIINNLWIWGGAWSSVAKVSIFCGTVKLLSATWHHFCMYKSIVCRYDITSTCTKTIVCRNDIMKTMPAVTGCTLLAHQNWDTFAPIHVTCWPVITMWFCNVQCETLL